MNPENSRNQFEGFVLAGGKSSRMGQNKALLKIGGETFVERAARILSPICENRVKIVLNQSQRAEDFSSFEIARDLYPERGAPGGIHTALSSSKNEWAIILACDLPLVGEETIAGLAGIALNASGETSAIVPRQPDGKLQPLCAVYRVAACLPAMIKLLDSGESFSVRDFLQTIPVIVCESQKTPLENEAVFFNVNTPIDYQLLAAKRF